MTELEVCYSSLAEMHAYELITPISIGKKNMYLSVCGSNVTRLESFFPPSSVSFLLVVTCYLPLLRHFSGRVLVTFSTFIKVAF